MPNYVVSPGALVQGELTIPGDKSISHRALLLASLAEGASHITGFLPSLDCLAMLSACRALGVTITGETGAILTVQGVGLHGLTAPSVPLDCGNSGTAMRLLGGVLAGQSFASTLVGDASLSKRPMERIAVPLRAMGVDIATCEGKPPLIIQAVHHALKPLHYRLPIVSGQLKSCLLLAALYAEGESRLVEIGTSRDHTERLLQAFSYPAHCLKGVIRLSGRHRLSATDIVVPGDLSSAAFFMVAAAIAPGSDLVLQQVGVNPTRTGIITLLQRMGASIRFSEPRFLGTEPVADLHITHAPLRGITISAEEVAWAIDECPILFVAAACATGMTVVEGGSELRHKESDRLAVMAEGLAALGIAADLIADGICIQGGRLQGGCVDSYGDHRVAMAFCVAALRASGPVCVKNCSNVATSFPNFVTLATQIGMSITVEDVSE